MNVLKTAFLAVALLFATQGFANAQTPDGATPATSAIARSILDLRTVAAGLVIIGAAFGIGMLAKAAVESQARQPEMANRIQTTMIIAAALIEGVTLFALVIILMAVQAK